jgi:hypothetical protein
MRRKVSPITKGSCMVRGQHGRTPAGTSKTKSATLNNSLLHWEVKSRGQTKM